VFLLLPLIIGTKLSSLKRGLQCGATYNLFRWPLNVASARFARRSEVPIASPQIAG